VTPAEERAASLGRTALDGVAEGVIAADPAGGIVWMNAAAERLLRGSGGTEAAAGRPVADLFRLVDRESGAPGPDPVAEALAAAHPLPLSTREARVDAGGAAIPIAWRARVARGADGQPCGVVVIFRDPDAMTLTPDELVESNRLEGLRSLLPGVARELNECLMRVLAGVTQHRAPGETTASAAAGARGGGPVGVEGVTLADAEQAALAASDLTKNLLGLAAQGTVPATVCPARELIEEARKFAAAGQAARITTGTEGEAGSVRVDRAQIGQALHNLILNAREAMPPPPHRPQIQLRAAAVELADGQVPGLAAGAYVEFQVRDNGAGIPAEHWERVWEPFFTTKPHRTGLGLPTALSLARRNGGQIALTSAPGAGSVFSLFLPRVGRPAEISVARSAPSARFGTGRVLLMDDDPRIAAATARMLEGLGYKVDLAPDGAEAIALYERYFNVGRPHDALLLDLTVVGGAGGEEALGRLRALDPDVRAIAVGGDNREGAGAPWLEAGFRGYLAKPFNASELGRVVRTVVG
jgi:CheY-like chemotaxis protein